MPKYSEVHFLSRILIINQGLLKDTGPFKTYNMEVNIIIMIVTIWLIKEKNNNKEKKRNYKSLEYQCFHVADWYLVSPCIGSTNTFTTEFVHTFSRQINLYIRVRSRAWNVVTPTLQKTD